MPRTSQRLLRGRQREPARHGRGELRRPSRSRRDGRAFPGRRLGRSRRLSLGGGTPITILSRAERHSRASGQSITDATTRRGRAVRPGATAQGRADRHDHAAVRHATADMKLALRSNGDRVVLNDSRSGTTWAVQSERPADQQLERPHRAEGPAAAAAAAERGHPAAGRASRSCRRSRSTTISGARPGRTQPAACAAQRLRPERRCHLDHRRHGDQPERSATSTSSTTTRSCRSRWPPMRAA